MYEPGEIEEKRARLQQLQELDPDNATVAAYLGNLDVEEDLRERFRRGNG